MFGSSKLLGDLAALFTLIVLFALVPAIFWPGVALAQEAAVDVGFFSGDLVIKIIFWLGIALGAVELAKRVCAVIPGKRDDEIVGWIELILRKILDFLAGKTGDPSDPSLVRKD